MKGLFKYLKNYRLVSLLSPLFKLLEAIAELFVPVIIADMIDNGILADGGTGYVIKRAVLLAVLALSGLLLAVTAQYFAAKAATGFAKNIREALFEKIQSLSFSQLDKAGQSTLITRLTSDTDQIQSAVNLTLRLLLRSPFIVIGAAVMAFTVDSEAAVTFVIVIPILAILVFGVMLACIPLYEKVRASLDAVLGKTRENLSGAKVIRAFRKEESEISEFDYANAKLTKLQKFTGRIASVMNPAAFLIVNIAVVALISTGSVRIHSGLMTQGAMIALYNYMSQILVELIKFADLMINVSRGAACAKRINSLLNTEPDSIAESGKENTEKSDALIEFKNVSFRYSGNSGDSLTDISFTLKKGETLGIIGGTGSGKTTLVSLIPRFYRAESGEVLINGKNVNTASDDELRDIIGVVPQKALLFSGTLRDNLNWRDKNASDGDIYGALDTACAKEIADEKGGLDALVEQSGRNFSGGQRQRLTIARALLAKPKILILDDSASALDFATEARLRKALAEGAAERATIIVSQRTSSIAHADKILVLNEGRQVGLGRHEELLQNCPVYREIYDSQFKKEDEA